MQGQLLYVLYFLSGELIEQIPRSSNQDIVCLIRGSCRIVGCSREMVGRVLKTLEDQGMIQTDGKAILIFDTSLEENAFTEEEFDDEE